MNPGQTRSRISACMARNITATLCAALMLPGNADLWAMQQQKAQPAQTQTQQPAGASTPGAKISNDQLDSLVAPIALYPDPLLGQMLVASTYPLEIVQLQQWLEQNKNLKDKALSDAVMKKGWDPSVQAMAVFPDVVKQMAMNIAWTDDLGNAFLAQQNDVMDAVQRMRSKAVQKGALKTTEQQKVETKVVEEKTVVVVQPAKTEVVYVPSYDPVAIWGAPYYPYPAYAYPAYPAGGMLLGFGVGLAVGAAWGGGWGWNTGWGNNNVYVNRNNTFINNTFINNSNRVNGGRYGGANGQWQHNPAHRGGAPYANQSVANRYNGSARGNTMSQRQTAARQNTGNFAGSQFRSGNATGANAQNFNRGSAGGGGDRIGNRQVSSQSGSGRSSSAFSGASSGKSARASSSRGASSMGSRGGGGFRGGGRRR